MLADEYDQLDRWVDPLCCSRNDEVVPALYRPHTAIGEPQSSSSPPVSPNRSRSRPTQSGKPDAFQILPGYHGERNDEGLFECFGDCRKHRFGSRGFKRRSNLLVHLRSCHGQKILKYDREESTKIRTMYKQMLLAGASEYKKVI